MAVTRLYHTIQEKICHLIPTGHAYRERNLAWMMTAIYLSHSVYLTKMANKLPGKAQRQSREQRFRRFLKNASVRVRTWYEPIAMRLLEGAAKQDEIRLIIDATKVTAHHQLLMVALAYRRRALPIAWTWIRKARGHSSGNKQLALLNYVRSLLPSNSKVFLLGDSEFTPLQYAAECWGWSYVLRQKGSHLFRVSSDAAWQRLDALIAEPGQMRWLTQVELTQQHRHVCNILAWWKPGEKEPWLLATNISSARQTKRYYSKRMWIEEMLRKCLVTSRKMVSISRKVVCKTSCAFLVSHWSLPCFMYCWSLLGQLSSKMAVAKRLIARIGATSASSASVMICRKGASSTVGLSHFDYCLISPEFVSGY